MENTYGITDSSKLAAQTIDIASRSAGLGGAEASTYTIINGLSIIGALPKLPVNTDHQGYTFFTKPQLNLSYDNVITSRRMSAYADQRENGAANAIRCLLQPAGFLRHVDKVAYIGVGLPNESSPMDVRSIVVDDKNPFITVLSNTLMSMNGFPDFTLESYTSNEGHYKEQVSWIDDVPFQYGTFDITADFANMDGDFITHLFHCWTEYASRVATGLMVPFPLNVVTNRIDYNTRIYRITTDRTKKYVQGIASTIAYPTALSIGAKYNFNREDRLNLESNRLSVPFRCVGVEYSDPILTTEFNRLVERFNPDMKPVEEVSVTGKPYPIPDPNKMVYISDMEKQLFDGKCYPFIAENMELQWYTPFETYLQVQELITKVQTL